MVLLFTGRYTSEYNRNKIILDGLKKREDITVIEYIFRKKKEFDLKKFNALNKQADFIFCPSFSHKYVRLIKKHATKPVIFDPLISNYLTKVFDYKNVSRWSPRAYRNYLKDKLPFKTVDLLLADTQQHKLYYHNTFGIPLNKIEVLPVGANSTEFQPQTNTNEESIFRVGFYGGFIPLQGVQHIIEAAALLKASKDIHFHLIGTGYQYEEMKQLVKDKMLHNITFEGWAEYNDLPKKLNAFDICLGIFGRTPKAPLVIPNKIYHYASMGKAVISMRSPAIKEVFSDKKDILLVDGSGESIAEGIIALKNNPELRKELGRNMRYKLHHSYNEDQIAQLLINHLLKLKA